MTQPNDEFDPDSANYTDDEDQPDTPTVTLRRDQIRSLERDARAGRKALQELAEIRQTQGFERAGLSLNETQRKAFDNAYDGDYSVESLQQFAEQMGWQVSGAPSDNAQDMAALDRVNAASAGSGAPPAPIDMNQALRQAAGRA